METYKSVNYKDYNHFYEVSNEGNVRNSTYKNILKYNDRNGYKSVCLYNSNTKHKNTVNIHKLVALTFIDNPENYNNINHIDGNKYNNVVSNLEWVTSKQNCDHAKIHKLTKPHPKSVEQYTKEGIYIRTFASIVDAGSQTGTSARKISSVCKGINKTSNGYIWKYTIPEERVDSCDGKIIEEFPSYKITSDGKVYSSRAKKFLVPKKLSSGYDCVKLCKNGVMKDIYVHKLVKDYYPSDVSVPSCTEKSVNGSGENSEVWEESENRDNPVSSS